MFVAIVILSVTLYFSVRTDNVQADNDLKYRYVKMKGEVTPEQLVELENLFGPNRDNERIEQVREDVEAYEEAVQRQAALTEQARLKEQAARELDSKAKSIKDKSINSRFSKLYRGTVATLWGIIARLKQMGKIRTAENYSCTLKSFMQFRQDRDILLSEIDSDLMQLL